MANIQTFLQNILSARYGKDVRQSIHDAIEEVDRVADTAQGSATEAAAQAEQYRNETEQIRNELAELVPEAYSELVEQVNENTIKIDTVIEQADLGIKNTATGEEIHITDSAEGKAVEYALYGKARQNTTQGNQLLDDTNLRNITLEATYSNLKSTIESTGTYTLSLKIDSITNQGITLAFKDANNGNVKQVNATNTTPSTFEITEDELAQISSITFYTFSGAIGSTLEYIMLNKGATALPWEPFTNGASPNPQFPQPIEVSGESYNLLENTATSQTINGVEFVVNEDKSVTVKGTATATTDFNLYNTSGDSTVFNGKYLSGCEDGSANTYFLRISDNVNSAITNYSGDTEIKNMTNTDRIRIFISVREGATIDKTFYPMIRKASVKNNRYMPFGVGSVEVKCKGKNLAKLELGTLAHDTTGEEVDSDIRLRTNFIPVTYNEKYIATNDGLVVKNGVIYDKNKNYLGYGVYPYTDSNIMHITHKDARYIRLIYGNASNSTINPNDYKYQLEIGQVASPYVPYKEPSISTIPTENGLAGIKVSSNGNYTDQNGQQWICDEVVKYADGSGAFVQRVLHNVYNGTETWKYNQDGAYFYDGTTNYTSNNAKDSNIISNMYSGVGFGLLIASNIAINGYQRVRVKDINYTTIDGWKEHLAELYANGTPLEAYVILATPIETPLTAEEVAEISTFYPITNISNDFDCGMKVTYNCDSKNYIDNKIAEMFSAMNN